MISFDGEQILPKIKFGYGDYLSLGLVLMVFSSIVFMISIWLSVLFIAGAIATASYGLYLFYADRKHRMDSMITWYKTKKFAVPENLERYLQ